MWRLQVRILRLLLHFMLTINVYQANNAGEPLVKHAIKYPDLKAQQVLIKITHCGVCRSDVHFAQNAWGDSQFPLVPGHEVVGLIETMGDAVEGLELGDRVGVAWQQGACGTCEWCEQDREEFCQKLEAVCLGKQGGFADHVIVDASYVYALPEFLESAYAAPLLCAGATVFNALHQCGVSPKQRIAVVGIGGLGHLALQFARAIGCHVTAISSSPHKKEEALALGADAFVALSEVENLGNQFDFILTTLDIDYNYQLLIDALRPLGRLCFAGIPVKPVDVSVFSLIIGQKIVTGIPLGNRKTITQMLAFAAEHQISPIIECLPMQKVNEALARVQQGSAHYRLVLTNEN